MRGRHALEHEAVVGDEHEPACELGQAVLQDLEGRDVEVVGGLVEDQEIGGLAHEAGDEDAGLLAAGQPAHRHLQLLGPEQEALGPRRDVDAPPLEDDRIALGGEGPAERLVGVEAHAVLLEPDDAQAVGALDLPGVGVEGAGEEVEQGRLAAAVRADEADPRAPGDEPGRGRGRWAVRPATSRGRAPPGASASGASEAAKSMPAARTRPRARRRPAPR